jgi:SLBB domain-containing protein
MRLWRLATALVVWMASLSASNAAETPSGPALSAPPRVSPTGGSSRPLYFGVMGEVACPGTYSAHGVWTLAELIKKAGGVTPEANKTVRIFRGGVLIEQVFLGTGESPPLSPNDLIVVGTTNPAGPHIAPAEPDQESDTPAVSAVQLAFVNLLDRPVIVKMPSEQATLPRIVDVLGQPAESAATLRVFPPLGGSPREAESADEKPRPLESGTVLVFPAASIHADVLPVFPTPIAEKPRPATTAAVKTASADPSSQEPPPFRPSVSDAKTAETAYSKAVPAAPVAAPVTVSQPATASISRTPDIMPHVDVNLSPPQAAVAPAAPMNEAATARPVLIHSQMRPPAESHAARIVLVMAVMSAVAGLAMLLTFISIGQRWLASGKLPFGRQEKRAPGVPSLTGSDGLPVPSVPAGLIRRPIRIDAGQPITRLSVDLAAIERATRAKSNR